nr:UvrD-like helicase, ATP-binding domain, P-loop containing nucleoside triphosphate hydrolase [Tanacetum cinerariifolium]
MLRSRVYDMDGCGRAVIARSWGDFPKEANLLEKAGEFQEVAMCLIWYVLFRAAWGDGNRGWPLKQFDQMEEICNKKIIYKEVDNNRLGASKRPTDSKEQVAEFISSLHGHNVAFLLRHMVGSVDDIVLSLSFVVVEHAYQLGNSTQKESLLIELYSTELYLFKNLGQLKERRYYRKAE